jgi:hypothetical protein
VKYLINQGLLHPPLEIELDPPPPCLFCGEPVDRPGMDGPLVCAWCDCGTNRDGTRWTSQQSRKRWEHRSAKIDEYRKAKEIS